VNWGFQLEIYTGMAMTGILWNPQEICGNGYTTVVVGILRDGTNTCGNTAGMNLVLQEYCRVYLENVQPYGF